MPEGDPIPDPTPDPSLGDAGKKALDAMKAERDAAKAEAREAATLRAENERLKGLHATAEEKALDAARNEGKTAAEAEANARIVRTEVKAIATGKLADPSDAARYLDLADFKLDAHGDVNTKAVEKAIADLIEDKPYLAAKANRIPGVASGARAGSSEMGDMNAALLKAIRG